MSDWATVVLQMESYYPGESSELHEHFIFNHRIQLSDRPFDSLFAVSETPCMML